jgi:hypothetical protein
MNKNEFIKILDKMINNNNNYVVKIVRGVDAGNNEASYIKFKIDNLDLFNIVLNEVCVLNKIEDYDFVSDENSKPSQYSITEKKWRTNKLKSKESKISKLNAIKSILHMILSGAKKENLISREEELLYIDVIESQFKYTSCIDWIKNNLFKFKNK